MKPHRSPRKATLRKQDPAIRQEVEKLRAMRKATTFRLEPSVQRRLTLIARTLHRPLNYLVNEAVRTFVDEQASKIVMDMEETLKLLKEQIARDPNFERAIAEFVDSEARNARHDPAEGQVEQKRGPMQRKVHDLLDA